MDDLDLLKQLPGRADPPDEEAKDRMRSLVEARAGSGGGGRRRRALKVSMLGVAAVLTVGSLAAGVALHPWTKDQPVGISAGTSPADPGAEGTIMVQIPNPTGRINSTADFESTVAEFAPSIRLPAWGSFDEWIRRWESIGPQNSEIGRGLDRVGVVGPMVWVSECQWTQQWLDASATADANQTEEAQRVLGGISDWLQSVGMSDTNSLPGLLRLMQNGDTAAVQSVENGCAYTGSWGTTTAAHDSKATNDLLAAVGVVREYVSGGGDPAAFDPSTAAGLAGDINWTWSHEQPVPAFPGAIFIAPSTPEAVTLVSVSESGTQYCTVITADSVVRGTTTDDLDTVEGPDGTPQAVQPGPTTCTPGGW